MRASLEGKTDRAIRALYTALWLEIRKWADCSNQHDRRCAVGYAVARDWDVPSGRADNVLRRMTFLTEDEEEALASIP